jgi:hypothetical protein
MGIEAEDSDVISMDRDITEAGKVKGDIGRRVGVIGGEVSNKEGLEERGISAGLVISRSKKSSSSEEEDTKGRNAIVILQQSRRYKHPSSTTSSIIHKTKSHHSPQLHPRKIRD